MDRTATEAANLLPAPHRRAALLSSMDFLRKPIGKRMRYIASATIGALVVSATSIAVSRLKAAAPSVDRASIWIDTVRRGQMLRQVQGPGTLVPEQIRWISAVASARVERIIAQPGAPVEEDTVLMELANPDLELQGLEAERQLSSAQAELANLLATHKNQRLAQESAVSTVRSELSDARRRAAADEELARKGFISNFELAQSRGKAEVLTGKLGFEEQRLGALSDGIVAQVSAQKAQIERLRSIAEFRRREVAALRIPAGVKGVLQELPLQIGQWVMPGMLLAKVAQPDQLKAEIRIAEVQAKDIQIGQSASVDTRNGIVAGHVSRIDPAVQAGTVRVDVTLDGALPKGARPDLSVEGIVELERLDNVLFVGRPAFGQDESNVGLFRLAEDGKHALRTPVKLGRSSVNTVEIKSGLKEGDQVILSDSSQWDLTERIRLQ